MLPPIKKLPAKKLPTKKHRERQQPLSSRVHDSAVRRRQPAPPPPMEQTHRLRPSPPHSGARKLRGTGFWKRNDLFLDPEIVKAPEPEAPPSVPVKPEDWFKAPLSEAGTKLARCVMPLLTPKMAEKTAVTPRVGLQLPLELPLPRTNQELCNIMFGYQGKYWHHGLIGSIEFDRLLSRNTELNRSLNEWKKENPDMAVLPDASAAPAAAAATTATATEPVAAPVAL